jgi:hypothetical protein
MRLIATLSALLLIAIAQWGGAQAANCAHPVTFCDTSLPPNCTKRCFNTIVTPDGVNFSIRLQDVPANLAPEIAGKAGVESGQAFHSGSRLLLKGLSKESVPQVLDRLNIDKSSVSIPK